MNWDDFERHSLSVDHPWFGDPEAQMADGTWNRHWIAESGHIHYHVWTQHEMVDIVRALGFSVLVALDQLPDRQNSFVVVCQKPGAAADEP